MVFAAGLMFAAAGTVYADETTFVPGTSVNGLGISDMSIEQAAQRIADFYASDYKLTIKEKGGKTETITGPEIGFSVGLPEGICSRFWISRMHPGVCPVRTRTISTAPIWPETSTVRRWTQRLRG